MGEEEAVEGPLHRQGGAQHPVGLGGVPVERYRLPRVPSPLLTRAPWIVHQGPGGAQEHSTEVHGPDLAADNAARAGIVVGGRTMPLAGLDLPLEGLVWEQNGQVVATVTSVVWLANKLAEWGLGLHPGDIVLAGAVAKILRPRAGESVRARFTLLLPARRAASWLLSDPGWRSPP